MALNMDAVFRLTTSVAGAQQLEKFNKTLEETKDKGAGLASGFGKLKEQMGAFAAAAAVAGTAAFIKSAIDAGDEMNALSIKTGVAVETLAQFKGAAELADLPLDSLAKNINKLNSAIIKQDDNGKLLKALGVNAKEGGEAMLQLADVFKDMQDPAARSALAVQLFGKSGADMLPMLVEGRDGISSMSETMTGEFAKAADNFNDQLTVAKQGAMNLAIAGAEGLLPALNDTIEAFNNLTGGKEIIKGFFIAIGEVVRVMAAGVLTIVAGINQVWERAKAGYYATKALLSERSIDAASAEWAKGSEASAAIGQGLIDSVDKLMAGSYVFGNGPAEAGGKINKAVRSKGDRVAARFMNEPGKKAADDADKRAEKDKQDAERRKQAMNDYISQLQETADTIGMTRQETEKYKDAQEMLKNGFVTGTAAGDAYAKKIGEIRAQIDAQRQNWQGGIKSGLQEYADSAGNLMENVKNATVSAMKGMEDALVNFVMTGKLNFKSLANSIIADLVRIMIQQRITGGIASYIGGLFPGGNGAAPVTKTAAAGGFVDAGQSVIVGEKGREIFTPSTPGYITPNGGGSGGGVSNSVVVNVNATTGETTSTGNLQNIGALIGAKVRDVLIQEQRPGGMLAKA